MQVKQSYSIGLEELTGYELTVLGVPVTFGGCGTPRETTRLIEKVTHRSFITDHYRLRGELV